LFPGVIASFQRLGVLAKIGRDPRSACRPFDRQRSGFLIGEGAACLVLERRAHAKQRDANCYGSWLGGRLASDPSGLTQSDREGRSLTRILSDLFQQVGAVPEYLNLHGTATRLNDAAECRAVRRALGAAIEDASCSGVKGSLGHLLGAAGSVELALTLLALRDQIVPPTVNLSEPDPDCDLPLIRGEPDRRTIRTAVKISSGFGGHLAVAAVGQDQD
jgi:3-oxoacyl-[acyl-carrier-protein] synthase II